MAKCPNCGRTLSCGCQKRTLPNGAQGCTNCLGKVAGTNKAVTPSVTPKNTSATIQGKAPVSRNVWGQDRYKNTKK
jgi:hypothetical protein